MIGLTIGGKHTSTDYGMRMLSFHVTSPEVQEEKVEVPGMNGLLDVSEALTGEPNYKNRTLTAKFDKEEADRKESKKWIRKLRNHAHGRQLLIVDDEEPEYYYEGRASVECSQKNALFYEITITADIFPYKLKIDVTTVAVGVNGTAEIICPNDRKSVVPTIISDAEMTLSFGNFETTISEGEHIVPDIKFVEGDNVITCTGNGTITFVYQEGAL